MKKTFSKKYRAFTLIELLLIVGIIAIMSAVLFASLNSNKSISRLKMSQREVASVIKLAQTYALQGKMQNGITPCGYGVKFTDQKNYEVYYNTAGAPTNYNDCTDRHSQANGRRFIRQTGNPNSSIPAETYSLQNGVKLCTVNPCVNTQGAEIYFTVPHARSYSSSGSEYASSQKLDLTLEFSGVKKMVTFDAGGSVSEEGQ